MTHTIVAVQTELTPPLVQVSTDFEETASATGITKKSDEELEEVENAEGQKQRLGIDIPPKNYESRGTGTKQ